MASNTIKLRATEADGQVTIKALITHPMELGTRKDAKTGELIPAHFIQDITVSHGGNAVVSGAWSAGVSKDPYLSVRFAGKNGDGDSGCIGCPRRTGLPPPTRGSRRPR
jgi:sulfur-oxidizing protein SoxZ